MRSLIFLLIGLLPAAALAQYAPGPVSAVGEVCMEAARSGLLADKKAEWLCMGAEASTPYDCFDQARAKTTLGRNEAIRLCRCAQTPDAPVACFESTIASTTLRRDLVIDRCRPIAKRRLLDNCAPLTAVRRRSALEPYAFPSE